MTGTRLRRVRIAQFGTYDVENYGDLLFPLVARSRLADLGAEIVPVSPVGATGVWDDCLPSAGPDDELGDIDAVLLGGGNIIHSGAPGVEIYRRDGLTALLAYVGLWSGAAALAEARGIPLLWNAPGVPAPIEGRLAPILKSATEDAAYVSVRDHGSRARLQQSGVKAPVAVVPDPALDVDRLWPDEALDEAAETTLGGGADRLIAVHLNRRYVRGDDQDVAALLDTLAQQQDARLMLLGLGPCHGDDALAVGVAASMRSEPVVISRPAALRQVAALIRGSDAYVGSSLHGFVTACAFGVPALLVASERPPGRGKFSGFLDHVRQSRALMSDLPMAIEELPATIEGPPPVLGPAREAVDAHWSTIRAVLENSPTRKRRRARWRSRGDVPVSLVADAGMHLVEEATRARERVALLERRRAQADAAAREAHAARDEAEQRTGEVDAALREAHAARDEAEQRAEQADRRAGDAEQRSEALERQLAALEQSTRADVAAVEATLDHRDDVLREIQGELVKLDLLTKALEGSRSWRLGHAVMLLGWRLTFRRPKGQSAAVLARRHAARAAILAREGNQPPRDAADPGRHPARLAAEDEASTRLAFHDQYQKTLGELAGEDAEILGHPHLNDLLNVLVGRGVKGASGKSVDVVVCVHNALEEVHRCLWSLTAKSMHELHLIVVNDGSEEDTTRFLRETAGQLPAMELIENVDPPHGYCVAANIGMRASSGDYVVLLNSDTQVTAGWLERIVECGESDQAIGLIGPLSNAASHQSVPELREAGAWANNSLPTWLTPDGMAHLVGRLADRTRPRLPFINGFCYGIKRNVIDTIGLFDEENFAAGYAEENDFSHRSRLAGFELAVADDAYVYHAKSRSYRSDGRRQLASEHYRRFQEKHGREEIQALVRQLEADRSLAPLRNRVREAIADVDHLGDAIRSTAPPPLPVAFVLPGLGKGGSGGSHSIYQEVKGMRRLGIPARIALAEKAWPRAKDAYEDAREVFVPFSDLDELAEVTADAEVISATHFSSVPLLEALYARRRDFLPAYYVQDYEPFFTAVGTAEYSKAIESYGRIPDQLLFAKTHWLCNVMSRAHGRFVAKVEPSLDAELFRVRANERRGNPVRVAAMIRPRTPRRQPHGTAAILDRLHRSLGDDVDIVTFGCTDAELRKVTHSQAILHGHVGLLKRRSVAELLSSVDVFLDFSVYQAFGRTALEAMACGCVSAVPRVGGASEYARAGENALVIDTSDEEGTFEALQELVYDPERLGRLQSEATATASRYSIVRAAYSEYVLFEGEHRRRFGDRRHREPQVAVPGES
jgi:GT2 family glycosyltransferase/polysaccharide pyruvyl transferase WcaK-like protein/glycosyltransferase involved in cell wall biosynthesis